MVDFHVSLIPVREFHAASELSKRLLAAYNQAFHLRFADFNRTALFNGILPQTIGAF